MPRPENQELYKQYKQLADATPGVHFVGRLATYKYYNMDQVTAQALSLFKKLKSARGIPTVKHGRTMVYPIYGSKVSRLTSVGDGMPSLELQDEPGTKLA